VDKPSIESGLAKGNFTFFLEIAGRIPTIQTSFVISMLYNPFCVVLSVIVIFYESISFNFPNLSDLYFN